MSPRILCVDMGGHRYFGSLSCVDWDPLAMDDEVEDEWALPPEQETNQDVGQDVSQETEQEEEIQEEFADETEEYTEIEDECVEDDDVHECSTSGDEEYPEDFQEEEEDEVAGALASKVAKVEQVGMDLLPEEERDSEWPPSKNGELHMYYSNLSSLANVHLHEPNLTVLSLIGQPLSTLDGIENLHCLKELWAVECKLDNISSIESCVSLEKLYLYSNRIRDVPKLENLSRLRVLWLASNDIAQLDRIARVPTLEELNVSKNRISRLVVPWANCVVLHTLNLSANPLFMLTDLLPLKDLQNICNLQLADPMYGDCPVAQLCNYRSYVVHQISSIKCLEQLAVTEEERHAVDTFYTEKALYYNMLRHHYQNLYMKEDKERMVDYYDKMKSYKGCGFKYKMKHLWCGRKEGKEADETANLSLKMEHLSYKVKHFEEDLEQWRKFHTTSMETRIQQITLEQQHTGNVRFREFNGNCEPMVICQRLLDSYVCHHLVAETGIRGTELLEVTHVTNKGLEVISELRMGSKTRRSSSIMLLAPTNGLAKPNEWPFDVVKRGFVYSGEYEVCVTNCLYYADQSWMQEARDARLRSSPALSSTPTDAKYERRVAVVVIFARDTLLVPCQRDHIPPPPPMPPSTLVLDQQAPAQPALDKSGIPYPRCGEPQPAHFYLPRGSAAGPGSGRPCGTYMIANAQLVLAMIVLEFRYVYADPLEEFRQRMSWTTDVHEHTKEHTGRSLVVLNESNMSYFKGSVRQALCNTGIRTFSLTTMVLTACGITSIGNLPKLDTITVVDLSFNKLTTLTGLDAFCGVRELNLSYNGITLSEEHVRIRLPQLKTLDLTWNNITQLMQALPTLRLFCPELTILDIRHNPVEDIFEPTHSAFLAKKTLRHLIHMNGDHMDDLVQPKKDNGNNAVWAAMRDWEVVRTPVSLRRLLETRVSNLQGRDAKLTNSSAFPYLVRYKGLLLTDIKVKDQFKKIIWADFSDNLLEDVKRFLTEMPQLEELSLRHNIIQEFPVLSQQWLQLHKLDLSRNYLKSITTFQSRCFPSLKLLDVSGNMLSDLNGIQACENLVECYAACNRITFQANILPAKNCRALRMLDLTGNPVEKQRDFRPFCVYHVRELEFLCGQVVEESDVAEAANKFGGRLDYDFLLKTPHSLELSTLRSLSLINSSIRKVMLPSDVLPHLERLDLSNNSLSCLWGLHTLPALKTLRLSHNQVASMRPPNGSGPLSETAETLPATHSPAPATPTAVSKTTSPFSSLRMLLLDNNRMASVKLLGLREMPQLSSLFLQQNELGSLEGLQGLANLRFLVLDENKIQQIGSGECRGLEALEELWVEGNRLTQLGFTASLRGLNRLFLAGNCIADLKQLRHLEALRDLREVTLAGNPLTRRANFQSFVRDFAPCLEVLDGEPVENLVGAETDSNAST